MAGEIKLTVGQQVFIEGCEYTFRRLLSPATPDAGSRRDLQFEETRTGHIRAFTHAEFDQLFLAAKITIPSSLDRPGDELPEEECDDKDLRDFRQAILKAFDANPVPKTDAALTAFAIETVQSQEIKTDWIPSGATVRRWLRERGEPGNRRRRHMGRRRVVGARKGLLDPMIDETIKVESEIYFKKPGFTATDVYAAVRTRIGKVNRDRAQEGLNPLRPPHRSTVWRRLMAATTHDNAKLRFGTRMANRMFKPQQTYDKPKDILESVIIDSTLVDCHVVDEDFPVTVGRPCLTVALDSYSRCVIGYTLGFGDPSVETAMACLRNLVRPKEIEISTIFPGIRGKFSWSGLPQTVLYDRAWGQVGSSMLDALSDIGVSVVDVPAGTPEYKAPGEHFFDTINARIFHKLPGAVPFKPLAMKERELDPEAEARLTLGNLHRLTVQALIDYANDKHEGIHDVPARLWAERAKHGIQYPSDLRAFNVACAKLAPPRILSTKGIELFGIRYCSAAVFDLLNDMLPTAPKRGRRVGTVEVKVKYFPEDLSRVLIWNEMRKRYVEISCLEERYTKGLSEFHHRKVEQFRVERGLSWSSEDDRCRARTQLNAEAVEKLNSRRTGNRRQAKKLLCSGRNFVPGDETAHRFKSIDAPILPCESVSNRVNGDQPERIRVRKNAGRRPKSTTEGSCGIALSSSKTNDESGSEGVDWFAGENLTGLLSGTDKERTAS